MACQFVETYPATVTELVTTALIPLEVKAQLFAEDCAKGFWGLCKDVVRTFNPEHYARLRREREVKEAEDVVTRKLIKGGYLRSNFPLHYPDS